MGALLAVLKPLAFVNSHLLRIGRGIGVVAVALMVVAILIQVVARYGLNNALPWPDEAARFCMLWMTGLMAPTAFRRGGFVAIDTLVIMLPKILASVLSLFSCWSPLLCCLSPFRSATPRSPVLAENSQPPLSTFPAI
jgi:TRAP-type C4-dicarboxylate transport system permease small subunit